MSSTPEGTVDATHAEDDFGWHLGVLLRAYQCAVARLLGELPHGTRGYQVLAAVEHGDQPNQQALAAHLGIDRTVMTYLIDDLVTAGLVERRQNPADRRARKVVTTPHGAEHLADLETEVRRAEDALLADLDPDERSTFRALLRRVACGVRDLDPTVDVCDAADQALPGSPVTAPSRR